MKKLLSLFGATCALAFARQANAQQYVLDDNFADSAQVYQLEWNKDHTSEICGAPVFKLPMGDTVTVERALQGNSSYALVVINDKPYAISNGDLLFCDNNPEGVEDIFGNTRERTNHSVMGKFFATMTPYWIIAILFLAAMLLVWLGLTAAAMRPIAQRAVPACLLVASVLEIWAYSVLGSSAFWWCDPERYGFFGSLFRAIPFVAFVAFQLYSIKLYMHLLTGEEENDLSIKPMLISIGVSVPVFLIVTFGAAGLLDLRSPWLEIIGITAFLVSLGIGLFLSTKRNISVLGKTAGLAFSIFGIVWSIGTLVAIIGLVIVIFKLILQILIIIAGMFAMAFAMGNGKDGGGNDSPRPMFYDKSGNKHMYGYQAEEANRKIDERRNSQ